MSVIAHIVRTLQKNKNIPMDGEAIAKILEHEVDYPSVMTVLSHYARKSDLLARETNGNRYIYRLNPQAKMPPVVQDAVLRLEARDAPIKANAAPQDKTLSGVCPEPARAAPVTVGGGNDPAFVADAEVDLSKLDCRPGRLWIESSREITVGYPEPAAPSDPIVSAIEVLKARREAVIAELSKIDMAIRSLEVVR